MGERLIHLEGPPRAKALRLGERLHAANDATARGESGVFEIRTARPSSGAPGTSLRGSGRAVAAGVFALSMRVLGLTDVDVAAALDVSDTVVRGLREDTRPLTVGDLLLFRDRLPELYRLVRDAIDTRESA